jgi:membrane-associated phospholipid phosphatase
LAFNGLMLLSLPSEGGHYVIDVIAGIAVVAVTIAIISATARTRWWRQLSGTNTMAHRPVADKRAREAPDVSF